MNRSSEAIIGIDLGGTNVRVGKVRGGELERHHTQRISGHESEEHVLEEIFQATDQIFDKEVVGIGCCVPSVVDVDRGIVYAPENIPSWRKVYLKDAIEKRYDVPAYVNNDANAFVLGELHHGEGRGYQNIVGLTLGTGLGAGIIIDGHLYCGNNCGAGEIGSLPYKDSTLETHCAGPFFKSRAGEAGESIFDRAQQGDSKALEIYHAYGIELGYAVMIVLYAFDPDLIVFGGSISRAFSLFEGGMRERLRDYEYQHSLERTVITCNRIENVALLGAAALYLDALG
jgi:glucokinase